MIQKEIKIKNTFTGILIFLLLISGAFLGKGYLDGHFNSVQSLRDYIGTFGILGPIILILIQMLQVILPVLPGFLGCAVGAGMFGIFGGFCCNYIGISAGSVIAFLLAKKFGSRLVQLMIPTEKYDSFIQWINTKKSYTVILFLSILLPLAPDDFLCYFSGLTEMSTKKFIWCIILAKPWCILFYSIMFGYFI
ncbi:MAG: TVP38/TMEM64 family protein [Lachnospiraceae bacterium]